MNNTRQPWHSSEGRKQYSLKPANPTEEGLASLHSVLFRKQPFLWRAALLYYTIERASRLSFSALFQDLEQYVQDAGIRWEYCVRAKRGQTDTSQPGTASGRQSLQCFGRDFSISVDAFWGWVALPSPARESFQAVALLPSHPPHP